MESSRGHSLQRCSPPRSSGQLFCHLSVFFHPLSIRGDHDTIVGYQNPRRTRSTARRGKSKINEGSTNGTV
jgi:hypothetical protein